MFGYVTIRKPELKVKDYECYQGYYCGLCHTLKKRYGFAGQFTLTYDMTFLVLLFSSLYEGGNETMEKHRCVTHPTKKHVMIENEYTEYAADLNMILTYYHFLDDKEDESSVKGTAGMLLYRQAYEKAKRLHQNKERYIKKYLRKLSELEKSGTADLEQLASCFGSLMSALFVYKKDAFSTFLQKFGYHLGKFIYIMDAYDDWKEDKEKGCFNPFSAEKDVKNLTTKVQELLMDEISAASVQFELLPCIRYNDILRNIIYAGVWNRFDDIQNGKKKAKTKK